jgi:acyl-coenzyme A synthetase/AMP-(fatty) acid ligase
VIQTPVSPTLDGLFRRVLSRQPGAMALLDPADKMRVTCQPPRRLTFAQADRIIGALAAHMTVMGLPSNSVVAIQLANTSEFILTVLAAHRAGLVVALLPQLWRQAELTVALNRTGARAIITTKMIDGINHADLAMNAAAEAFAIRYVGGFGSDLPDGMVSLDEVIADGGIVEPTAAQDARRAAIVTFDVGEDGMRAVPRTHLQMIAGGLSLFLESALPQGAGIMAAVAPSSFAGLTSTLVTWLLTGGTLALHHPFDADALEQQLADNQSAVLILPAPLAFKLAEDGLSSRLPDLRHVIALWRAPEQIASSEAWTDPQTALTDIYLFGEAGLFSAQRGGNGLPAPIMPGPHGAPRRVTSSSVAGDVFVTERGTLALRGPMMTPEAYVPLLPVGQSVLDYVDTGYAARIDRNGAIIITAPPAGIVSVGGYRFLSNDLNEWARRLGQGALLTALPDRLNGHRLAGRAQSNARAREALTELGLNPLMVDAFRDRSAS